MERSYTDNSGQISLDYLIGVTIFLITFIFVFAFIPGMFAPFHSNSDEITMAADRAAAVIVENTLAIGGPGDKQPCILDAANISEFNTAISNPATSSQLRQSLGLNTSSSTQYNLEVVIEEQGKPGIVINSGEVPGTTNVGQSKRYVLVRDRTETGIDSYPGRAAIVTVRIW